MAFKRNTETTPVIFRADRSGDFKGQVTAVFPTLPADIAGRFYTCFAHVGQHSSASRGWYNGTRTGIRALRLPAANLQTHDGAPS